MGREGEWQSRDQTGYNGDLEKKRRNKEGGSFWFSPAVQTVPPDMNVYTDSGQNMSQDSSVGLQPLFFIYKIEILKILSCALSFCDSGRTSCLSGLKTQKGDLKERQMF